MKIDSPFFDRIKVKPDKDRSLRAHAPACEWPGRASGSSSRRQGEGRMVGNAQRKALDVLGLEADAGTSEIKTRFKALVKRHHPDANGGDRSSEDKLREIIQAYNYLKSIGFR